MNALIVASLLLQASIAMTIAAAGAAIWCALVPAEGAAQRRRVWVTVVLTPLIAAIWRSGQLAVAPGVSHPSTLVIGSANVVTRAVVIWGMVAAVLGARLILRQVMLAIWASSLRMHNACVVMETCRIAGTVGLRKVHVVAGVPGAMPLCWGFLRPTILLPGNAGEWPRDVFHSVALHECSHLAQGDNRLAPLIELVCAVFWFHPGAWLASMRLHADSERACDERVVAEGIEPYRYAMQLLSLARTARRHERVPAAAFLGRGELEERVSALMLLEDVLPQIAGGKRRAALVPLALVMIIAISPTVRLAPSVGASLPPVAIPGAHPSSFGTTLFGGR